MNVVFGFFLQVMDPICLQSSSSVSASTDANDEVIPSTFDAPHSVMADCLIDLLPAASTAEFVIDRAAEQNHQPAQPIVAQSPSMASSPAVANNGVMPSTSDASPSVTMDCVIDPRPAAPLLNL